MVTSVNRLGIPLLEAFLSFSFDGSAHRQNLAAEVVFCRFQGLLIIFWLILYGYAFCMKGVVSSAMSWLCDRDRLQTGRQN